MPSEKGPSISASNPTLPAGPRLWPLALGLSAIFWIVVTSGGQHIFVKEWLGEAYDSQAEHLLQGDPGVDLDAIRPESILIDGKPRMYFGPFPAFIRVPLNLIYPSGRGYWSRVSGFSAAIIALFAFAGLLAETLRASPLSPRARTWTGNICLAAFAFGSPLIFLAGNLSIYNESIIWGLAWAIAALYFAFRILGANPANLTRALLGFSISAGCSLLSRATFGAPLILIALILAIRLRRAVRWSQLAALFLPLGACLLSFLLLSYAKFGNWTGQDYAHYVDPIHREFALKHGVFDLRRVPTSFADYFNLRPLVLQNHSPFLKVDRHPYVYPSLYSLPFSEVLVSMIWTSSWIIFGTCIGLVLLFRKRRSDMFDRGIALALLAQVVSILSFFALAHRYAADLWPFLIFCFLIFLRNGIAMWQRIILTGLVAVSIVINVLGTASWIGNDRNLPVETQAFWKAVVGNPSANHGSQ